MDEKCVLAMYDIRGKQEFIFRTDKLQEIVGGSLVIRDCFDDYLFPAAERTYEDKKGIFSYKNCEDDAPFSKSEFDRHIAEGYIGEVVYDGGGNFILLYENETAFRDVTYEFTKDVMKSIGTLKVLATCIEVSDNNLENYREDSRKLYAKHRVAEANECNIAPWSAIPIVQVDRKTSQPLVDFQESTKSCGEELREDTRRFVAKKGVDGKVTKESFAKLKKYNEENQRINSNDKVKKSAVEKYSVIDEKILDNIVEEKGKDSKLAVVYIDGNSLGAKVQKATKQAKSYEQCAKALREFSAKIQNTYIEGGIEAALGKVAGQNDAFRIVVSAGDEINFIVKAKDAFDCAKSYLDYLETIEEKADNTDKDKYDKDASACAGIAVFHSHTPYADAYRIAEEACESGKKKMKELGLTNAAFIDFHIIQGAIGTSLEDIREDENRGIISRPWMIWSHDKTLRKNTTSYSDIELILSILSVFSRTNVKELAKAAKLGDVELEMELNRMYAHLSDKKKDEIKKDWDIIRGKLTKKQRDMIYDISISYDLWFDKQKGES